jgi:hypothetical protein
MTSENVNGNSLIGMPDSIFRSIQATDGNLIFSFFVIGSVGFPIINKKILKKGK